MKSKSNLHNEKNLCVFDIGSNSVIATLVSYKNHKLKVYLDNSIVSGLARGLKDGLNMDEQDILKTIQGIGLLKREVDKRVIELRLDNVSFFAFGTEALRSARNFKDFNNLFEEHFNNISLKIISGQDEANLLLKAVSVIYKFDLLIDIGGGSTEFVLNTDDRFLKSVSVGARTLSDDRLSSLNSILTVIKSKLETNNRLIITGGTISAFVAGYLGLKSFSQQKTESFKCSKKLINEYLDIFYKDKNYLKDFVKFDKGREEVLVSGLKLIVYILDFLEIEDFIVSNLGARFGYIITKINEKSKFKLAVNSLDWDF